MAPVGDPEEGVERHSEPRRGADIEQWEVGPVQEGRGTGVDRREQVIRNRSTGTKFVRAERLRGHAGNR